MAKKETKKNDDTAFDLEAELQAYPEPDWYKEAFTRVMDTGKIKSKSELDKALKEFGAMK
jgi:hypothetical protein